MGYDFSASSKEYITTHAQAINHHQAFFLSGGVDLDEKRRKLFIKKFNKPAFISIIEAINKLKPDIIIVSVPTPYHLTIFEEILNNYKPLLIIIEKPLSFNMGDSKKIINLAKLANQKVAVNFFREYDHIYRQLRSKIASGIVGFPLKIVIHYTKGIINNGSHFIKYISHFMSKVIDLNVIENERSWNDIDPELDLRIKFEKGVVYFISHKEENFSYYEMEIIGPKGKLRFSNSGSEIELWKAIDDPDFDGYRSLEKDSKQYKLDFNKYQLNVYDNIYHYLSGSSNLFCDLDSMNEYIKIYEKIEEGMEGIVWYLKSLRC